ncbi:MAG: glycoside hydrolase family protein [Paludibacter sp.]
MKLNIYKIEYWIKKGFSEEESINLVEKSKKETSCWNKEFWIKRGFSEEESVEKIKETQKNNVLKRTKESYDNMLNPYQKEYWIKKGLNEEEIIKKINEQKIINNPYLSLSKDKLESMVNNRRKTYYSKSEEELKIINKKRGKTKNELIEKHGFDKANETAKGAMVDLAFNMGQWWNKFPATAKSLAAGDFAGAAEGLKNSKWYQQVKGRAAEITGMIAQGASGSKPGFAQGGVTGGNSGYTSMPNMGPVVSLPNGKTIPVQQAGNNGESEGHLELLSMELDKLDSLVRIMAKQNDVSTKILRQQS